jgi:hypothetical protein
VLTAAYLNRDCSSWRLADARNVSVLPEYLEHFELECVGHRTAVFDVFPRALDEPPQAEDTLVRRVQTRPQGLRVTGRRSRVLLYSRVGEMPPRRFEAERATTLGSALVRTGNLLVREARMVRGVPREARFLLFFTAGAVIFAVVVTIALLVEAAS